MPLRRSTAVASLFCLLLVAAPPLAIGQEAAVLPVSDGARPTSEQIMAARELLNADPAIGKVRKQRMLKWKERERDAGQENAGTLEWLRSLFSALAGSVRIMLWVLAAALAAFIAIYVLRLLRARAAVARSAPFIAPSHVRDLDIRPESLPADIGVAAMQLWESGEQRRALALLYRGLLSRMVHQHHAPVRDSTTEGECIALARSHLPTASRDFAAGLVTIWQRAVYGELAPPADSVRELCRDFAPMLDGASNIAGATT